MSSTNFQNNAEHHRAQSGSMESLSKREIMEKEEMVHKLSGIGIYEPGYTYQHMKNLLGFIYDSKDVAKNTTDNNSAHNESTNSADCSSKVVTEINSLEDSDSQACEETPKETHSYVPGCKSPVTHDEKSLGSTSTPKTMSKSVVKNSASRRKSSDGEDSSEKLYDGMKPKTTTGNTSRALSLSTRNILQERTSTKMVNVYSPQESWKINPLDCRAKEEEPLCASIRHPAHTCVTEKHEQTAHDLSIRLKEVAELWRKSRRSTDPKSQWGSPIKVGTASNSPQENRTNIKSDTDSKQGGTVTGTRECHERACKRKATLAISRAQRDLSSNDEEDDVDVVYEKRRKIHGLNVSSKAEQSMQSDEDMEWNSSNETDKRAIASGNNDKATAEADSETKLLQERLLHTGEPSHVPMKSQTKQATPSNCKSQLNEKGLSPSSDNASQRNDTKSQAKQTLTDKEISRTLDVLDSTASNEPDQKDVVIKPLPMKNFSVRLERSCALLELYNERAKQKLADKKNAEELKKEEEEKTKLERYKRRREEREEEYKKEMEAQKMEREKTFKWNKIIQARGKSYQAKAQQIDDHEKKKFLSTNVEERIPLDGNNDRMANLPSNDNSEGSVNCPICNKTFPSDEIENHAAECEQYNCDTDDDQCATRASSARKKPLFECNICSSFTTSAGIEYEDHVNTCLQRTQERNSPSREARSIIIGDASTSPIRCFRSISEQSDSEINYKIPFSNTSGRTKMLVAKKRKR